MITLTIPNDDTIVLRQFGKALIEIATAKEGHPADVSVTPLTSGTDVEEHLRAATETLQQAEPEVDTTVQQVESLSVEQIADDLLVTASKFLNAPPHVLTGQGVPPTTDSADTAPAFFREAADKAISEDEIVGYEALQEHIKTKHIELVTSSFIDTDSTGTPWDERIHSTSRALNADGTWRLRRKPKDKTEEEWAVFVESVKGELHTQTPVMTDEEVKALESLEILNRLDEDKLSAPESDTGALVGTVEPPVTPPGDDFHTDADVVTEQTVAGIPPLPVPPPVVVAPPVPEVTEWDFPRLMTFLTERHGKIDVATVNTLLAQDGMSSVQELNAHPDKIGPFVARVKAHLGE